ncbi:MAG TPA: hypothetical protein VMT27_02415 [Actinomycetes bacterium]|nr:hypothetical protein [Actinomycetes bacterium]
MELITVVKADLLDTLRSNRDEHRSMFIKAQEKYREAMIEELDRALSDAKAGRKIKRAFSLPIPEDHTEDFDTAIEMLEWDQGDTVDLGQRDFLTYVKNNWGWQASFAATTQSYLAVPYEEE